MIHAQTLSPKKGFRSRSGQTRNSICATKMHKVSGHAFFVFCFSSKLTLTTQDSRKTFSKLPETTFRNPGFDDQILCGGLMATAQLFRFTLNTIG